MEFQKDQSGKALGARLAVMRAYAHERIARDGEDAVIARFGPDFLFSLCSALLFLAEFPISLVFLHLFQFARPPLQGFTGWGGLDCTPAAVSPTAIAAGVRSCARYARQNSQPARIRYTMLMAKMMARVHCR
jgi:hypothetical protein